MTCDIVEYVCTINLGSLTIALLLVACGISITLYDVIENIMEWWNGRKT